MPKINALKEKTVLYLKTKYETSKGELKTFIKKHPIWTVIIILSGIWLLNTYYDWYQNYQIELQSEKERTEFVRDSLIKDSIYKETPEYKAKYTADSILLVSKRKQDSIAVVKNNAKIAKQIQQEENKFLNSKAGKYYKFCKKKGYEISRGDCERAANGKIWIGMNIWLVICQRGNPEDINISNYGNGNRYQYVWSNYSINYFYDNNNDNLIDSYN